MTDNVPEEGSGYSEYRKIALGHCNSAAQFNARCLIVDSFGQFAILALLETWPVLWLTYLLILPIGCCSILNYLMFALLIEELRAYDGTAKIVEGHRSKSASIRFLLGARPTPVLVAAPDGSTPFGFKPTRP